MLHNTISNKVLKSLIKIEGKKRITISFYKYFHISSPKNFRDILYEKFYQLKIFGRIYIAFEGINAQISVLESVYKKMKITLETLHFKLSNLNINFAIEDSNQSFWVLNIKVRKKILNDGIIQNINLKNAGKYLNGKEVNTIIEKYPDTIFLDMRNQYEYEIGHFKNAITVLANTFREQLDLILDFLKGKKEKKIIMYCTGGIRCEKSSALLKFNGFKKIYQIKGGILEYVRYVKNNNLPTYFKGKIFVFDKRMKENISNEIISRCHQCNKLCDTHVNCKNDICHFLFIQCDKCKKKYKQCCSFFCIQKYKKLI